MEQALHVLGIATLAVLVWGALRAGPERGPRLRVERSVEGALGRWTVAPPAETLAVAFDSVPGRVTRAWLAALRRAGTGLRWSATELPPIALEVDPRAAPRGGTVVRVAAPAGAPVVISDSIGPLDSTTAGDGASFVVPHSVGEVVARIGRHAASALADAAASHRVVVLGDAGWESRFVVRALEEQGWTVDARLAIGPGRFTQQGRPLPLDMDRHGAVILVDSVPADVASQVVEFVRHGGGLVLGARRSARGTRRVAPAAFGEVVRPSELSFVSAEPRAALAYRPLEALRQDAVVLERRDGRVVVAARRERAGRVIQLGYEDTWRWRMLGGDDAPAAHAAWWSDVVAAAAYRPETPADRRSGGPADGVDPAPYASLVDELGEPAAAPHPGDGPLPRPSFVWLLGLAATCFLAEWTSRRLRGES